MIFPSVIPTKIQIWLSAGCAWGLLVTKHRRQRRRCSTADIWQHPLGFYYFVRTIVALGELNFLGHKILKSQGMLPNSSTAWSVSNAPLIHHPTALHIASSLPNLDHSRIYAWECRVNRKLIFWKIKWNRRVLTSSRYRISFFIQFGHGYQVGKNRTLY